MRYIKGLSAANIIFGLTSKAKRDEPRKLKYMSKFMRKKVLLFCLLIPSAIVAHNLSEEQSKELTAQAKHLEERTKAKTDLIKGAIGIVTAPVVSKILTYTMHHTGLGLAQRLRDTLGGTFTNSIICLLFLAKLSIAGYAIYKGFTGFKHLVCPDHPKSEDKGQESYNK
jgi:hypothetical protein